jgi:uncharacterized protein GlcG (DUF336 family)
MRNNVCLTGGLVMLALSFTAGLAHAQGGGNSGVGNGCKDLPSYSALKAALTSARGAVNGGFNLDMWATVVDRDGIVCAVAFTGGDRGDQWPGSRVISAQKANTANAFSLPGLALSTANLYSAVQPGGSLYGLQQSNPVSTDQAYSGNPANYGQPNDPMVGGGGLGLYNSEGKLLGAIGVSGDTSCADHNIAWRARNTLNLDYVPGGVAAIFGGDPTHKDNIIFDITPQPGQMPGTSTSGFGHPHCGPGSGAGESALAAALPATR